MIVKLQRPLYAFGKNAKSARRSVIMYNRDKSVERLVDYSPALKALFGGKYKIYADVKINGDEIGVNGLVEDPGW